jgi:sigma-E factor negative regulatory protein RseB
VNRFLSNFKCKLPLRLGLCGILFCLALPVFAVGSQSGLDWLKSMRKASSQLSYRGVLVYIRSQQVDSFKLIHSARDGQEQEKLLSMSSPLREVVRTGGSVSVYSNDGQHVVVDIKPESKSLVLDLPEDPSLLARYYEINLRGQEYVAGHLAQVVALEPKDHYRYTRLIWIDTEQKLPLKFEVLNDEGESVEQMVFTSLNLENNGIPSSELEPSIKGTAAIAQITHREVKPMGALNWTLNNVPDGFQIVSYVLVKRPPSNAPVEQILLSDGFSSVSVYIEKKTGPTGNGSRTLGAINVDTVYRDGFKITAMGEVPGRTVEAIAQGLRSKVAPAQ